MKILPALLYLGLSTYALHTNAQQNTSQDTAETQVYNAVFALMKFPKQEPHILISAVTLNSGCGEKSGNPVLMNNCGIIAPPQTDQGVQDALKQGMPMLDAATWTDFRKQNIRSETLSDRFVTTWPHVVADISNANGSNPWKSLDGAIFLSRLGFNKDHTQGIVYILFFSYMTGVHTSGNFFLFQTDNKSLWQPVGRVTSIQMQ